MVIRLIQISIMGTMIVAPFWAKAQTAIDRVDPARIERENLPAPAKVRDKAPNIESGPVAPSGTPATAVEVGAVTFAGLDGLAPADFADIIARYIGRTLSGDDLSRLTEEVSARARGRGYVFASARIEPQQLKTGVLTLRYDPGTLDDVRIEGDDNRAVRDALAPLIGRSARLDEVERRLLLAGDIDGVSVRRSRFEREAGRGILVVTLAQTRLRVRAMIDNDSTAPIGPLQSRVDVDVNGVLASDDRISITHVMTPTEPDELQYIRGRYAKRISRAGTEIAVAGSLSWTQPGAYLDTLDIAGRGWFGSVSLLQPLYRRRDASLWFSSGLDLRDSRQQRAGRLRRHDRIFALRLSLNGNAKAAGGTARGNLTLSRGLDAFGSTAAGDPYASRDDADGVFTQIVAWGDWTRPLGDGFSLRVAAQGQVSSDPLLIAEEIGIGGSSFLRGYDYSERSGDEAYMGSSEVRYDWRNPLGLGRKAQLYSFLDGGRVTNLAGGFGGGSLASGGGGIRADVSSTIDASVEVAVPLSGPRYETGTHQPRINLRLLKLF